MRDRGRERQTDRQMGRDRQEMETREGGGDKKDRGGERQTEGEGYKRDRLRWRQETEGGGDKRQREMDRKGR